MFSTAESSNPGFEAILRAVRDHTHTLLGRTITYSAEDWAAPTRLPGWTRSHVAAHLIKGARALSQLCRDISNSRPPGNYNSGLGSDCELLALADGLKLQIELDTTAGELDELLAQLTGLKGTVRLRPGLHVALHELPLVRLRELVLHTFDLEPADEELDVDPGVSLQLLEFETSCVAHPKKPTTLVADEGFTTHLGGPGASQRVMGPASALLAYLARNVVTSSVNLGS